MPRYELRDGASDKFWEITRTGAEVTTRYGRIGTDGRATTKAFASAAEATARYEAMITAKTKKGYVLASGRGGGGRAASSGRAPVAKATTKGGVPRSDEEIAALVATIAKNDGKKPGPGLSAKAIAALEARLPAGHAFTSELRALLAAGLPAHLATPEMHFERWNLEPERQVYPGLFVFGSGDHVRLLWAAKVTDDPAEGASGKAIVGPRGSVAHFWNDGGANYGVVAGSIGAWLEGLVAMQRWWRAMAAKLGGRDAVAEQLYDDFDTRPKLLKSLLAELVAVDPRWKNYAR